LSVLNVSFMNRLLCCILESRTATEIRRVVRVPAFELRHHRVLAEDARTRSGRCLPRCRQSRGSLSVFHPRNYGIELTRGSRSRPTAAMPHPRCQEKSDKLRRLLCAAHLLRQTLVEINAAFGGDQLIRPSMPPNQLSAVIAKRFEIGIIR